MQNSSAVTYSYYMVATSGHEDTGLCLFTVRFFRRYGYLTIIPRARMGSESIAHEAKGGMGY